MTNTSTTAAAPEGCFVGRGGKIVPKGQNQYTAYGVRRGRRGTRVVFTQTLAYQLLSTAMIADTAGVSNATGRGFDSVEEAQEWCDTFILAENPGRIAQLRAEVDDLVVELAAARSRM
ncbi:hypothetical protein PENSPDRAFT_669261 [Peniophora sp. CONT]|nr:hypothetical protein PENSPDRAFT_669261 [Peniophora sp. CONT]